jgi:hypothetical protein
MIRAMKERMEFLVAGPFVLAHEGCHYLAARGFGFAAQFRWDYSMTFYPTRVDWRSVVVFLSPSLLGWVFVLCNLGLAIYSRMGLLFGLSVLINVGWQITCWSDLQAVGQYWRTGNFPAERYVPSLERLAETHQG